MVSTTLHRTTQPLYFGAASRLYGCLHVPACDALRETGIVLCQPIGDEYVRSHRACCQLAQRLARQGFCVLRFDYSGCGDSAGDEEFASLRQWTDDVLAAADELERRCRTSQLCLVGVRMGGALALAASAERPQARVVLWDPVFNGRAYLENLGERHAAKLRGLNCEHRPAAADDETAEFLGYKYSSAQRREIARINPRALAAAASRQVVLIDSGRRAAAAPLADQLSAGGAQAVLHSIPDHQVWKSEIERMLVPHRLLQAIVAAIAEACA